MRTHHKKAALALLLCAPLLGGADSCITNDLLLNASFDLWCGEDLCSWEVEQGEVVKVATWHDQDSGAELRGETVKLSQFAPAGPDQAECVVFSLMADAEAGASLTLELDYYDNGSIDWSSPISAEDWDTSTFRVRSPEFFHGIRFRVVKQGDARAVIAQVRAEGVSTEECSGEAIVLSDVPPGGECTSAESCGDGFCEVVPYVYSGGSGAEAVCSGCGDDGDCGTGQACGMDWTELVYGFQDCIPAGEKALGEVCVSDAECGSGICNENQCSECSDLAPCAEGACERHEAPLSSAPAQGDLRPHSCSDTWGSRAAGEGCVTNDDCDSGSCLGEGMVKVCDPDGRPCDIDADCPLVELGAQCVTVAIADGVCQ